MKKLILMTSLLALTAPLFLTGCGSEPAATTTTTTTRQTTVAQPAATTRSTTVQSSGY
jgi:uncharacterized lipoprotein YajG